MIARMQGLLYWTLISLCMGCRRAPSFNVLGSYFPGWIVCTIVGILIMVGVRTLLYQLRIEQQMRFLPLVYMSLTILFSCVLWLIFFE